MVTKMSARKEAIQRLDGIVQGLTAQNTDLKSCLRSCQQACQLLGWQDQRDWFQRELNGYPDEVPLPLYRKIQGKLVWAAVGNVYDQIDWTFSKEYKTEAEEEQVTSLDVRSGIDWLVSASQHGYWDKTGQTRNKSVRNIGKTVTVEQKRVFAAASFSNVLSQIEQFVYDFSSAVYVQLEYSEALTDIWTDYRSRVDLALQSLGLTSHLSAVQTGIRSDNPEEWRNAVFGCRNLLNDLANHLWQDPRPTYDLLKGSGTGGKLDVKQGKFANRLSAYLHQRSIAGTRGKFLRTQLDCLSETIRSLIAYQSEAHDPIDRDDANSIAVATYFVIGELALRTDMQPVSHYVNT